ncbi:LysE/ArgO family amino acid transporter [Neobacillus sp. LXY-4]|uniref:LysE/ArgO family amino acid transporter n=1 Tax=Neobacillus sp. LXY-4 TaxID=3379826 RepID=UPI003EE09B20
MISAAIHGFILALGLILPLGVQNVFVFNQGASHKKLVNALPVVITAAICDTFLITLAVLGFSVVVLGIQWIKLTLLIGGIVFLFYMGFVIWKSKPSLQTDISKIMTPRKQMLFAASVSLLNPHAIMDTIGVIGTSSISYIGQGKIVFTLSCIFVSWIWFFGLAIAGRAVGNFDRKGKFLTALNKISAIIMWGTAIYLIFTIN